MEAAIDPIALFGAWLKDAEASELNDPSAMALATASRDGMPSVRMVLMKQVDARGFCFFTNAGSQKGVELAENPRAAIPWCRKFRSSPSRLPSISSCRSSMLTES